MTILITIAAVIPTLIYVALIYWADRYEKEPVWLLSATFLWGALPSVILAIIINALFSIPFSVMFGPRGSELASSAMVPIVEETVKGLALIGIILVRRHEIDTPLDGIIYGATVGMGFAMVENFFYFYSAYEAGGLAAWTASVFFRAGVFGLNHALFSSLFGLGLAVASLTRRASLRLGAPIIGWSTAISFHAIHNAAVSFDNALFLIAPLVDWGGIALVMLIVVWALRQERRWLKDYLAEEVLRGTLTITQYELIIAARFDVVLLQALLQEGFNRYRQLRRFFDLCAKLAARKHHVAVHEQHPDGDHHINHLRSQIHLLSSRL